MSTTPSSKQNSPIDGGNDTNKHILATSNELQTSMQTNVTRASSPMTYRPIPMYGLLPAYTPSLATIVIGQVLIWYTNPMLATIPVEYTNSSYCHCTVLSATHIGCEYGGNESKPNRDQHSHYKKSP